MLRHQRQFPSHQIKKLKPPLVQARWHSNDFSFTFSFFLVGELLTVFEQFSVVFSQVAMNKLAGDFCLVVDF